MKLIHGMGLFALSGFLAACSLNALDDGPVLSIRIEDRGGELPGARVAVQASGTPTPPATLSGFDCIGINVIGPGIPDTSFNPEPFPPENFGRLLRRESYCTYRGILAGPLSATATTAQELSLQIPSGNTRLIQIVGLQHVNGSNDCYVEFTPGARPPIGGDGRPVEGEAYELGRVVVDLFQDRAVSIAPEWNGLSAADRAARVLKCENDSPPPSSGGNGQFVALSPLANVRTNPAVLFDDRLAPAYIHVAAGDAAGTSESLNLSTQTWTSPSPIPTMSPNINGSALAPGPTGSVLIFGGALGTHFDRQRTLSGGAWGGPVSIGANMQAAYSAPLIDAGATYVFGGWGVSSTAFNYVWKYTHATGAKTALGSLQEAKWLHASALLAPGLMIVVGGQNGVGTKLSSCDRVNGGVVSTCAALPVPLALPAAAGIGNNRALVAGGVNSGGAAVATAYVYDHSVNTWTATAPLPGLRAQARAFPIHGGAEVLVLGGGTDSTPNTAQAGTYIYTVATGTWRNGPNLITPRTAFGAVQAPDGRIFVIGGTNSAGSPIANVEVWQP